MRRPEIDKLFQLSKKLGASDLILKGGDAPQLLVQGLTRQVDMVPLTDSDLEILASPILESRQREGLNMGDEVTLTHTFDGGECNVELQRINGRMQLTARFQIASP